MIVKILIKRDKMKYYKKGIKMIGNNIFSKTTKGKFENKNREQLWYKVKTRMELRQRILQMQRNARRGRTVVERRRERR